MKFKQSVASDKSWLFVRDCPETVQSPASTPRLKSSTSCLSPDSRSSYSLGKYKNCIPLVVSRWDLVNRGLLMTIIWTIAVRIKASLWCVAGIRIAAIGVCLIWMELNQEIDTLLSVEVGKIRTFAFFVPLCSPMCFKHPGTIGILQISSVPFPKIIWQIRVTVTCFMQNISLLQYA